MAGEEYSFRVEGTWSGGEDGHGTIQCAAGRVEFGIPAELGGAGGRSSPEEMLLNAVASCYCITYGLLAERRKLPFERVEIEATGSVVRQPGGTLKFVSMLLKPRILLKGAGESQIRTAEDFAHKAEQYCLISSAIRGNVEISLEPEVINL